MSAGEFAAAFGQAQQSTTYHRKNALLLHKAFIAQASITSEVEPGRIRLTGEKAFADGVKDMLDRILQVKKGVVQADRAAKFLTSFIAFAVERGALRSHPQRARQLTGPRSTSGGGGR